MQYALGNTRLISQDRGGTVSYFLHDGQGSTRLLTDATSAVTDSYSYTAFGDLYAQTGMTENPYLYTGQQGRLSSHKTLLDSRIHSI